MGYKYKETSTEETDLGTKTKEVIKEVVPDTTAQIFWLKNRRPDKWRDKAKDENEDTANGNLKDLIKAIEKSKEGGS